MIKSMTGFASLTRDDQRATIGVTVRAVNHRFLDLQIRLPGAVADLEPRLRALVQKHLARGRVEVSLSLQLRQPAAPEVELNEEFLPTVDPTSGAPVAVDAAVADVARIDAHHEIDLAALLADELALAEPMHPLCRPDCPGLCVVCGARLDAADHADHAGGEVDPRLAALADWKPARD